MVVYYLIQSNTANNTDTWSKQFRIARFELKDGIRNLDQPFKADGTANYIRDKEPDAGFALFKLNDPTVTGTLEDKMNSWKKGSSAYELSKTAVLVDYIDASPRNDSQHTELIPVNCTTVFDLDNVPSDKRANKTAALTVPSFSGTYSYSTNSNLNNSSFYACVDIDRVSAKIFIRGNAYARINEQDTNYDKNRQSYFPTANIQVKGKGAIGEFNQ